MLAISQILLLLVGYPSVMADVSADDGVPQQLAQDSVDISTLYSQSRFIPLSFNAAIHQNGSRERAQGPCYDFGYSCNGAVCCDNGSCAGNGQICCGDGICDAGYGCCQNIGCVADADTCCANGGSCPAGQGCFSFGNSNQIVCSPTGGGTEPATSTVTYKSTTSPPNEPTSVAPASLSVYYYTYVYEWTTSYYVYEIESSTTYIVTTVLSVMATDSAAATSSFNAITATAALTAPPTSLPGGSIPSPSPAGSTLTAPTSGSSTSGASTSGAVPSAKNRPRTLSVVCTAGAVMMAMMMLTV